MPYLLHLGRTGLMITAFLPYRYEDKIDVETSLSFYAERRTMNNKVLLGRIPCSPPSTLILSLVG